MSACRTPPPNTCMHMRAMRAQVCADTLRDGAAVERTLGEAHYQGLFWNLLSKSPAGAVGFASSPLGEPVLLPAVRPISFDTLQPPLGGSPVGQGFYPKGPATVLQPSLGVQTLCANARWAGLLWARRPACTQSFGLCTHRGWGHSAFTRASESSVRDRCLVCLLRDLDVPDWMSLSPYRHWIWVSDAPFFQAQLTSSCLLSQPLSDWGGGRLCPELSPNRCWGRGGVGPGPVSLVSDQWETSST